MTGKRYQWHLAWSRLTNGRIKHVSGLEFVVARADDYIDINVAPETLDDFQKSEIARGVPVHDLAKRLMRLAREAGDFERHEAARVAEQNEVPEAGRFAICVQEAPDFWVDCAESMEAATALATSLGLTVL